MTTTTFLPHGRTLNLSIPTTAAPVQAELPDVPTYHPAKYRIQPPRGVKRIFTDSEMHTAAVMLDKLCGGHERVPVEYAQAVHPHTAEQVIDIVAERLLDRL